jgi:hypothetical protein
VSKTNRTKYLSNVQTNFSKTNSELDQTSSHARPKPNQALVDGLAWQWDFSSVQAKAKPKPSLTN